MSPCSLGPLEPTGTMTYEELLSKESWWEAKEMFFKTGDAGNSRALATWQNTVLSLHVSKF